MELKLRNQAIVFLWIMLAFWSLVPSVVFASSLRITIAERAFSDEFAPILTESGFVIPLELATLFGAEVSREGTTVLVRMGQNLLELEAGNPTVRTGAGERQLPMAPLQLGGSFYVPLRFFADFLGLKLSWNALGDTLDISPWTSLGGSSRQNLAAFRTIDEALQMIDEARRQIAPPEPSPEEPVRADAVATSEPADEPAVRTESSSANARVTVVSPPTGQVGTRDGAMSDVAINETSTGGATSISAQLSLGSATSPVGSVTSPVGSVTTPVGSITAPEGQLPTVITVPSVAPTPSAQLLAEANARQIAAAIARLLLSDAADESKTDESKADETQADEHRDDTVESTGIAAGSWPLLKQMTGVSLVKEVRDGQFVYLVDSETDVTLSTSMLVEPFRLVFDMEGVPGHEVASPVEWPIDDLLVEKIRAVDYQGHLRLIFDMKVGVGHTIVQDSARKATLYLNRPLRYISAESQHFGGRIWLDVDPDTPFNVTRLPDPDRWMIDLQGVTVLSPERLDLQVPGPVASVRSAQFLPDVARVVLDLTSDTEVEVVREQDGIALYYGDQVFPVAYRVAGTGEVHLKINHTSAHVSVFRLISPDRLVVDVSGLTLPIAGTEQVFLEGPVSRLRVSQYDDTTARIVADLRYHVMHGLKQEQGQTIVVMRQPTLSDRIIVVDAGHGGIDGGAVGRTTGLLEKDVNLDIAYRLAKLVEDLQGAALLTRPDDAFYDLWSRPRLANEWGADVFVSIHANTAEVISPTANGTEVYVKTNQPEDLLLGQRLLEGLVSALGTRDRGVRENRYLVVRNAEMPAALVEVAFLSDEVEEELLSEPWFRQRAADGILNGLLRYFHREEQLSEDELASVDLAQAEWTSMGGNTSS